jgi:mRNA interferase HigB
MAEPRCDPAGLPGNRPRGALAVFNIKGNHYRLIVRVEFPRQRLFIKEFLTHAEYNKGAWKKWLR